MSAGGWGRTHTYLEVVRGDFWCVYIFKVSKNKCILFFFKKGGRWIGEMAQWIKHFQVQVCEYLMMDLQNPGKARCG